MFPPISASVNKRLQTEAIEEPRSKLRRMRSLRFNSQRKRQHADKGESLQLPNSLPTATETIRRRNGVQFWEMVQAMIRRDNNGVAAA